MNYIWLIPYYISWHYTRAYKELWSAWRNILHFLFEFFSIHLLLRTLFQPFERLKEKYHGGLDIENFLSTMFVNFMMRIVGFIMRISVIIFGIIFVSIFCVLGLISLILWLFVPLILGFMLLIGIYSLFGFNIGVI